MPIRKAIIGLFISILGAAWVSSEQLIISDAYQIPEVVHPDDNLPTPDRWALGKRLFFDPIMSRDGKISCASCHDPSKAFSDDVALSMGVDEMLGTQNAPSLTNVAFHPYFTRAGGVPTLEMQVLVPIQEHNEFGSNIIAIADRMKQDSTYVELSKIAYGREPDAFVITRALACFERSLVSTSSKYDRFLEDGSEHPLNEQETAGMRLFFSDQAMCSSCHSGFNFTDYAFKNNGLYLQYPDSGRHRFTGMESDRATFKVPSLRNLGFTAPYMHDGSIEDLEAVIEHYSAGIKPHPNLSSGLRPLGLSKEEQSQLIAFLKTLDDFSFVQDLRFKNTAEQ